MATTTTFDAMRDNMIALLEALTPSTAPSDIPFRRSPRRYPIRTWVDSNPAATLRRFEITRLATAPDPGAMDPAVVVNRTEFARISIAYPASPGMAGEKDLDDLEKLMRRDATQVRDLIFSAGNYLPAQHAAFVTIEPPDQLSPDVWFQDFTVELIYQEAQSLT